MGVHVGGKVSGMIRADPCRPCHQASLRVITSHLTHISHALLLLSGAHMNAAVSLTMCAFGRLAWKMLPLYVFAQLLGSFLAAGTIYAVYYGEGRFTSPCLYFIAVFLLAVIHLRVSVLSILFPYAEAIYDYCGGNLTVTGVKATAGIFATYPAPYLSLLAGFIDQVAMKPD